MRLAAPRSLFGQFALLNVVVAAVAAGTLLLGASALLHQTADHFQRDLLRRQADLAARGGGGGRVLADGMAVSLVGTDRRVRSSAGPPRPAILAAAPLGHSARFFRRGRIEGYSVPARGGWVVVSQDDADPEVVTDDIVRAFLFRFALIGLPLAALVPLIGASLARRLTLRMRAVSAIAATIGPRSRETRLPLGLLPREAEPLAAATNAALDRLAEAIRVQTAFAADVAHELRTPLAAVRLRADAVADASVRTELLRSVDRAARVVAQLLALAELERPVERDGARVDLPALAAQVVAERAPEVLAAGRTIALEQDGASGAVAGFPDALTLALENLIDNARRHTPAGTAIVVRCGPGARLAVEDDGPPLAAPDLARLRDRLWRGARAGTGGAGIGLSIVERVARAHGGTLRIARGDGGCGLSIAITFADAA